MTQAIGYVRVSTADQAENGISLDAQRARLAAYAAAHELELVSVYADEGVSGKSTANRPGLEAALAAARERCCPLIVTKLDRLSRSTRDVLRLVELAGEECWELHSIDERLDTSSAMGRFVVTIMAGLAQMEREQIGERTRAALAAKRENGEALGAPALGERVVEDADGTRRRVAVPAEMEAVEAIRRMADEGRSHREIAAALEEQGARTKRGGRWTHVQVGRILRRERVGLRA